MLRGPSQALPRKKRGELHKNIFGLFKRYGKSRVVGLSWLRQKFDNRVPPQSFSTLPSNTLVWRSASR